MILLTGATGRVGSAAASALAAAKAPFKVLVRSPENIIPESETVEIVQGDLSDTVSVERALHGITRSLIVMANHPEQSKLEQQFATLADKAGVSHLVKVSSMEAAPMLPLLCPRIITTLSSILHR